MTAHSLKKQIELLRLRRTGSQIAVRLYEAAKDQTDIEEVNALFDRCNRAHTNLDAQTAIEDLIALAKTKDITIDL